MSEMIAKNSAAEAQNRRDADPAAAKDGDHPPPRGLVHHVNLRRERHTAHGVLRVDLPQ